MRSIKNKPLKVALLGAESSGKTTLATQLREHYDADVVYEYAREYMSTPDITYEELEHIAEKQYEKEEKVISNTDSDIVFFDTEMINLKVWFTEVFGRMPVWLEELSLKDRYDLYLITDNSLTWEEDVLRENKSLEKRNKLTEIYTQKVQESGTDYGVISGDGEKRFLNAVSQIDKYLSK